MELETDKAVIEVPSSIGGVVLEIKVKEGQKVKVGEVIFTIEGGAAAPATNRASTNRSNTCRGSKGRDSRFSWRCGRGQDGGTGAAAGSPAGSAASVQHAGATGQGCGHGPRSHSGCAARAAPGA